MSMSDLDIAHNSQPLRLTGRDLTLYGGPSNRGGRVIWALEELGLPYQVRDLALFKGEQRTPEFLALNPQGKVPALVITEDGRSETLTESLAILYVLAQRYGEGGLWPESLIAQAECHQWMAFGATELEPPIWAQAKHTFVYPEKRRVAEIFPTCLYEYKRAVTHLERALSDERDWLCGAQFCIADLWIAHTLMWGNQRQMGALPERVSAYLKRAQARPAWRRVWTD